MAYWLLKSEPDSYGWADLVRDGGTEWDGVRNPVAAANLKRVAIGDEVLIYHTGKEKAAVGIAKVTREAQPEEEGGRWVSVRVEPVKPLPHPVTLKAMKAEPALAEMVVVRQGRLSVAPVSAAEWKTLLGMAR